MEKTLHAVEISMWKEVKNKSMCKYELSLKKVLSTGQFLPMHTPYPWRKATGKRQDTVKCWNKTKPMLKHSEGSLVNGGWRHYL